MRSRVVRCRGNPYYACANLGLAQGLSRKCVQKKNLRSPRHPKRDVTYLINIPYIFWTCWERPITTAITRGTKKPTAIATKTNTTATTKTKTTASATANTTATTKATVTATNATTTTTDVTATTICFLSLLHPSLSSLFPVHLLCPHHLPASRRWDLVARGNFPNRWPESPG